MLGSTRLRLTIGLIAVQGAALTPHAGAQCDAWLRPAFDFNGSIMAATSWDPDGAGPEPAWLVVGGDFRAEGATPLEHVAAWDGKVWRALGGGLQGNVRALAVFQGELYAAGAISTMLGDAADGVARWDGVAWRAVGLGLNSQVRALLATSDRLYAGGEFTASGDTQTMRIAAWDGEGWAPLGAGVTHTNFFPMVMALAQHEGSVYAGGFFNRADGNIVSNIARWTGTTWEGVGAGLDHVVHALASHGGTLVAGGSFTSSGGVPTPNAASWDGLQWSPMGPGLDGVVFALESFDGALIAAGDFSNAGPLPTQGIAMWDGAAWSAMGQGIPTMFGSGSRCLATHRDELIAVGFFFVTGPGAQRFVARWSNEGVPWFAQDTTLDAGAASLEFGVRLAPGYDVHGNIAYRWHRNGQPIADGPGGASQGGGTVQGSATDTLTILDPSAGDAGQFSCTVTNRCGSRSSRGVSWPACPADLDDGTGSGSPDGGVDISDLLFFLALFDAGDLRGDLDDGTGTGTRDQGVDISDLLYFLVRFEGGC